MAFAHTDDLAAIVVATGSSTGKHINLLQQSQVALLIDTDANPRHGEEFYQPWTRPPASTGYRTDQGRGKYVQLVAK